jgi:hypothetical protein
MACPYLYREGSFDVVMFIDVLHHASQPMMLLREAVRIAREAIVLKDHLAQGSLDYLTLRIMDWVGNARHGVALPYNYWSLTKRRRAFDKLGLRNQLLGIQLEALSASGRSDPGAIFALYRVARNAE